MAWHGKARQGQVRLGRARADCSVMASLEAIAVKSTNGVNMETEMIELRHDTDEKGRICIIDQHGRKVRGVKSIAITTDRSLPQTIELEIYAFNDGRPQQ